jgi:succinoglycan biosynthesis transport protein ExoP
MPDEVSLVPRGRQPSGSLEVLAMPLPHAALNRMGRETQLRDYLIILRKHLWLSLFFLLAVVTVVTIATFKMRPVYEAVSRVQIDRDVTNFLPFQGAGAADAVYYDMDNYIQTQAKVLQSETLALQTIQDLHLAQNPEFGGAAKPRAADAPGEILAAASPENLAILGAFQGRLTVKRIPESHLMEVRFEANNAKLAADVVNTHVQNFIERSFRARYESTTRASDWLAKQLDELKIKVEKSEDARLGYERANQIWTIDEKQNTTTQKLSDLNKELTQAQTDRIQKEANYTLVKSGRVDSLPGVQQDQVIQGLLNRRAELSSQYTEALSRFGPKYPKALQVQAQLKDVDQLLAAEKQNITNNVESEYRAARQREVLLTEALEKQKVEANALAERLVQYNILKREADANKALYEGLLQKLKEASISAGLRSSDLHVVDPALVPGSPARPQKTRNLTLALLVGLVGGIGLAFLREYLDNTVKTPDDVEHLANLPSLAVVPIHGTRQSAYGRYGRYGRRVLGKSNGAQNGNGDNRVELISQLSPQSAISEAFRALRTSLLLSQAEHAPQIILVTSALPREGKTTAVMNLAVTLAQLGDRTLIVDGDMRKPGISKFLGMGGGKYAGLSTYLAGVSSLDLVTVPHPNVPNLSVILSGPVPPNPADLLSAQRLQDALTTMRGEYRFVVWDSPPIMAATDAVIVSSLADGVLLIVRSGTTPKEAFVRARDLLGGVRSRMLGVLLNAVDTSAPDYYYSYKYYPYHYGYGTYGKEESTGKELGT